MRIEDQDSANGVTVNGLTVHAAQLSSGDVIQIGDQRLVFEVEGQAERVGACAGGVAPGGGSKGLRLVLAATADDARDGRRPRGDLRDVPGAGGGAGHAAEHGGARGSVVAARHDDHAFRFAAGAGGRAAGARGERQQPVDWLFDEGQLAYKNGRLLDAYRLLHGALLRDPQHEASRRLLLQVMGERELRLNMPEGRGRPRR